MTDVLARNQKSVRAFVFQVDIQSLYMIQFATYLIIYSTAMYLKCVAYLLFLIKATGSIKKIPTKER